MRKTIAPFMLFLCFAYLQVTTGEELDHVVLPNPKLLRCASSDCYQLWSETPESKAVFPKQVIVDTDQGCIYGMTALYDKSVRLDLIKSAIEERYRQWSLEEIKSPALHLWRAETQKFSIQLSVANKADEKKNLAEAGTRQVIYIAFGAKSACGAH